MQGYILHFKFYKLLILKCNSYMSINLYGFSTYHTLNLQLLGYQFLALNIYPQESNQKNSEVCIHSFNNL